MMAVVLRNCGVAYAYYECVLFDVIFFMPFFAFFFFILQFFFLFAENWVSSHQRSRARFVAQINTTRIMR